ncbi:MAG: hypothetical protein WDM89_01600 [Rhizomicrobium sp.]
MNLGEMKLTDLSAEIQDAIAKTQSGRGHAAVPLVGRHRKSSRAATSARRPRRRSGSRRHATEVEKQLFQQQISMLARRYIRDLRRQANVETR